MREELRLIYDNRKYNYDKKVQRVNPGKIPAPQSRRIVEKMLGLNNKGKILSDYNINSQSSSKQNNIPFIINNNTNIIPNNINKNNQNIIVKENFNSTNLNNNIVLNRNPNININNNKEIKNNILPINQNNININKELQNVIIPQNMPNQNISINNIQNKIILPGQLQNKTLIQQNINNNSNQNINQNKNSNLRNPLNSIQIPPPTNNHNISQNNGILSSHKTMINMIPQQTLSLINKDNISFNDKNNQVGTNIKVPFNNPIPFLQNLNINNIGKSNSNPNFLSKPDQYYQLNPFFIKQHSDDISQNNKINIVQPIENNYINYPQNNTNISHYNQSFNINKHEINAKPSQNMIVTNNNMNLNINKQYQGNNNIPSYLINPKPNTNMIPQSSMAIPHQDNLKMANVEMPQQNINYSISLQSQDINNARRQNINLQNFSQNYYTLQPIPNSSQPIQNVIQQKKKIQIRFYLQIKRYLEILIYI